jgi:hypothetical protein
MTVGVVDDIVKQDTLAAAKANQRFPQALRGGCEQDERSY